MTGSIPIQTARLARLLAAAVCGLASAALPCTGAEVDFNREIRPLLRDRCFRCHGPDEGTREAGLRLDQRDAAILELDSGLRAIVPGQADQSELLARVTSTDPDFRMPPPDAGPPLSDAEIRLLARWIDAGAPFQAHWAFVAPRPPSLPKELTKPAWVRRPLDTFVLARMDAAGLQPAQQAVRHRLIRRVSLALTGLPPTPSEVSRFVQDSSPDAYERLVDRLLQSPAFGERWARVWLDLARYADSAGYAQDPPRVIWRFRDWTIDALNRNLPYDQFTIQQLAGDLLAEPTLEQLLATAFHRNTMTNSEGGTDDEEFRNAAVVDRVNTTMQVWMGITMGCAQCHSHKYDPISQEEYFQFFAVFNNTEDADRGDEEPTLEELTETQAKEREALGREIAAIEAALVEAAGEESEETREQLQKLKQRWDAIVGVKTPILRELQGAKRRQTHIHLRGNFLDQGDRVTAGVPAAFHSLADKHTPATRLSIAQWLVRPDNPLTARVTVNRYWEQLFGRGIVETSEDFGTQGEPPSHPQLLDYLAVRLMEQDWDLKWLLREIVLSATYRQSSHVKPAKLQQDPRNRWLSRGPTYRLSAEMIRDQALAISGLLSRKIHGPSVRPPRPVLGLRSAFGGSTDWETSPGEDRYRRGLYTSWRRTTPYPSMTTFDAPSREVCTIRRVPTNTPLQALVTLNDPVFVEAAQALAGRIVRDGGDTVAAQCRFAFRLCVARPPTAAETNRLVSLYRELHHEYMEDQQAACEIADHPQAEAATREEMAQWAAWTVVANVLLNLDETLTIN